MKKGYYLPVILLIIFHCSQVHSQTRITGKVVDSNNAPLAYATIQLLKPNDSVAIWGSRGDVSGNFSIEYTGEGDFVVVASVLGFRKAKIPFRLSLGQREVGLGIIRLNKEAHLLKDVVVVHHKPLYEYKIDRTVINVQENIATAGGTALDVLERSPGVNVNKQKNEISLNAKSGVIIMIDGKISHQPLDAIIQMLGGMSAGNIDKIELISNPPAQYDAGSNAGIINIILRKRSELGTNGTISATVGYGRKEKAGVNLSLNNRTKYFNIYGDLSFNRNHTYQYFTNTRVSVIQNENIQTVTSSDRDPITTNFNGRIGVDYYMNRRVTISGLITGFSNKWQMGAVNNVTVDSSSRPSNYVKSVNSETNHWINLMGNLNLNYKLRQGEQLSFDLDYLYYHDENPTNYNYQYFDGQYNLVGDTLMRAGKTTPINIYIAKIDYAKTMGKVKWESGVKGTFSKFTNDAYLSTLLNNSWVSNPDFTRLSYLNENISALYTTVNIDFNKKTSVNAGLRYEYTNSDLGSKDKGSLVDRNYGNIFPTLFVSRKIATDNTLQFSYGRRITRPAYNNLAPFIIFLDPTTYFYGNEYLQSALSDAVKLGYLHKSFMLSIEYNHQNNAILQYEPTVLPNENVQVITSLNLKYRNTLSLLLSLPFKMTSWWTMDNSIIGADQQIQTKHLVDNVELSSNYYRINTTQTFRISPSFTISLSGLYQSKSLSGLSEAKPFGTADLGIQKKIQQSKGTLRFSMEDIFWTATERNLLVSPQNNLNVYGVYKYEPRVLKISYTYNFGNTKPGHSSDRETGSEDIMKRVK